jgi:hypothetical protein
MCRSQQLWSRQTIVLGLVAVAWFITGSCRAGSPLARDDFEHGLSKWVVIGEPTNVRIVEESGAEPANHVLELVPQQGGFVHTLLRGSEGWTNLRIEGRVLFPTSGDGYLGLIYNHRREGSRTDFGCLFVKSNGSYVRVSPHHDGNPSWRLYEELKVPLEGPRRVVPNRWYPFRLDVIGSAARFAFEELSQPLIIFDGIQMDRGAIGFEARPGRGDPVWIDDIVVRHLDAGSSTETSEAITPISSALLTHWEALGPFAEPDRTIESGLWSSQSRSLAADQRGMVITGRISDFGSSSRHLVYLRTTLDGGNDGALQNLVFSTANRIDAWLGERHLGTMEPQDYAWTDFLSLPDRAAPPLTVALSPGPNILLLRVDGRRFAGGGFLAAVIPTEGIKDD